MKRILIIDDEKFARLILRELLWEKGYEVCGEAENGERGIELFLQLKPDLTICDIRMPKMSGEECIERILAQDPNAKVIVCAAINAEEKVDHVLEMGVRGVIRKPVNHIELANMLAKVLGETSEKKSYKELFERSAAAEGIETKAILDFCAAFKSISGMSLDNPKIDRDYLKNNGDGMLIGMRALLSAKVPLAELNKLEQVFSAMV